MNHVRGFVAAYHPIVHTLFLGTLLSRLATSMTLPFLAVYLATQSDMSATMIGVTVGLGPLAGTMMGFVGGTLSDRFGRKRVMLTALYVWAGVLVGFAVSEQTWLFMLFSALNGICRVFFEPVSQALMGDLTPQEQRYKMFSVRYTCANIGFAVGPMLGAFFGLVGGPIAFFVTAGFYLLYALMLNILLKKFGIQKIEGEQKKEDVTIRSAFKVIIHDRALLYFIVGGALMTIGYSQFTATLSQHLTNSFADGVALFAAVMTTNAVTVVSMQIPFSAWAANRPPLQPILLGSVFYALGNIGFAFADSWFTVIAAAAVFTLGEVLTFPAGSILIDKIAPEGLRGAYYGAQSFRDVGRFVGPTLGLFLLSNYGAMPMFFTVAVISLFSSYFYIAGYRIGERRMERSSASLSA